MSWLFKTLQSDSPTSTTPDDAVKDDFSVIGHTIGRQLRGVAAFLAPPPTSAEQPVAPSESRSPQSEALVGIRNDLAEIGGSFKSGLSLLSSNKAVTGISKFASKLLQYQDDDHGGGDRIPGITELVVGFVKEISERSECWIDFPLSVNDDFEMSDAQQDHVTAVEQLVPSLRNLRMDLKSHMEDSQFWTIYFILILPRLEEHDFRQLSTPKIIETRNVLLEKLQNMRNAQKNSNTPDTAEGSRKASATHADSNPSSEKRVSEIVNATRGLEIDEGKPEQWFEDTDTDTCNSMNTQKANRQEVDVSFSDFEDDSDFSSSKRSNYVKSTSPSGSNDWVQLNRSSASHGPHGGLEKERQSVSREKDSEGESSDWLAVDEYD